VHPYHRLGSERRHPARGQPASDPDFPPQSCFPSDSVPVTANGPKATMKQGFQSGRGAFHLSRKNNPTWPPVGARRIRLRLRLGNYIAPSRPRALPPVDDKRFTFTTWRQPMYAKPREVPPASPPGHEGKNADEDAGPIRSAHCDPLLRSYPG